MCRKISSWSAQTRWATMLLTPFTFGRYPLIFPAFPTLVDDDRCSHVVLTMFSLHLICSIIRLDPYTSLPRRTSRIWGKTAMRMNQSPESCGEVDRQARVLPRRRWGGLPMIVPAWTSPLMRPSPTLEITWHGPTFLTTTTGFSTGKAPHGWETSLTEVRTQVRVDPRHQSIYIYIYILNYHLMPAFFSILFFGRFNQRNSHEAGEESRRFGWEQAPYI